MSITPQQSAYAAASAKPKTAVLAGATQGPAAAAGAVHPLAVPAGWWRGGNLYTMARLIANRRLPPLPRLLTASALVRRFRTSRVALAVAQQPDCAGQVYTVSDAEPYTPRRLKRLFTRRWAGNPPGTRLYGILAAAAAAELVGRMGLTRSGSWPSKLQHAGHRQPGFRAGTSRRN